MSVRGCKRATVQFIFTWVCYTCITTFLYIIGYMTG